MVSWYCDKVARCTLQLFRHSGGQVINYLCVRGSQVVVSDCAEWFSCQVVDAKGDDVIRRCDGEVRGGHMLR